eukprot:2195401-Rhodomonas_salina.4
MAVLTWGMLLPAYNGGGVHEGLVCAYKGRPYYTPKSDARNCVPGTNCAENSLSCVSFWGVRDARH